MTEINPPPRYDQLYWDAVERMDAADAWTPRTLDHDTLIHLLLIERENRMHERCRRSWFWRWLYRGLL